MSKIVNMSKIVPTWIKVSKFGLDLSKTEKNGSNCQILFKTVQFFEWNRTIRLAFRTDHISKTFYMSDFVTFGTYFFMENKLHSATK